MQLRASKGHWNIGMQGCNLVRHAQGAASLILFVVCVNLFVVCVSFTAGWVQRKASACGVAA